MLPLYTGDAANAGSPGAKRSQRRWLAQILGDEHVRGPVTEASSPQAALSHRIRILTGPTECYQSVLPLSAVNHNDLDAGTSPKRSQKKWLAQLLEGEAYDMPAPEQEAPQTWVPATLTVLQLRRCLRELGLDDNGRCKESLLTRLSAHLVQHPEGQRLCEYVTGIRRTGDCVLVCISGALTGQSFCLQPGPGAWSIGRGKRNTLCCVGDDSVSTRHAEVVFDSESGHFKVKDLGSTNGTLLHHYRSFKLTPGRLHVLTIGDVIKFGGSMFKLCARLDKTPVEALVQQELSRAEAALQKRNELAEKMEAFFAANPTMGELVDTNQTHGRSRHEKMKSALAQMDQNVPFGIDYWLDRSGDLMERALDAVETHDWSVEADRTLTQLHDMLVEARRKLGDQELVTLLPAGWLEAVEHVIEEVTVARERGEASSEPALDEHPL